MPGMRRVGAVAVVALLASGCATLDRVSTASDGRQADAPTTAVAVSGTGRYVAFESVATNLVSGGNGRSHVYRKDRATGAVLNIDRRGSLRATASTLGDISDDGMLVAFVTSAPLAAADTNGQSDAYVRDVEHGSTILASTLPDGRVAPRADQNGGVYGVSFGGAHRVVVEMGTGRADRSTRNVLVRDLDSGFGAYVLTDRPVERTRLSRDGNHLMWDTYCPTAATCLRSFANILDLANQYPHGLPPCSGVRLEAMSDDGRYLLIDRGSRCVLGAPVGLYDRVNGTWLQTAAVLDLPGDRGVGLSGDGRFVAVSGDDTTLPGGRAGAKGFFVVDTQTGWTGRMTASALGRSADVGVAQADAVDLAQDGLTIAFTSGATDLVVDDTNGATDAFARVVPQPSLTSVAPASVPRGLSVTLMLSGVELLPGAVIEVVGGGVTVAGAGIPSVHGDQLWVPITVAADAVIGPRDVVVRNPAAVGAAVAVCAGCLSVT